MRVACSSYVGLLQSLLASRFVVFKFLPLIDVTMIDLCNHAIVFAINHAVVFAINHAVVFAINHAMVFAIHARKQFTRIFVSVSCN